MKEKTLGFWKAGGKMIHLALKYCPTDFFLKCLLSVLHGLLWGINILMTHLVFDRVTDLALGQRTIWEVLLAVAIFTLVLVSTQIINGVDNFYWEILEKKMHGVMCRLVAEKTAKLDPILFENPKILDDINKASEATHQADVGIDVIALFTFYGSYFIFMAFYLYYLNPILIIAILFAFVPKFIAMMTKTPLYSKLENKSAPIRRESDFYEQAMTDRQFFKETRILGAFNYFKQKYLKSTELYNKEKWRTDALSASIDLFMSLLSVLGYLGILFLLFVSLQNGSITIGAFAAVFGSIALLIEIMDELLIDNLGETMKKMGKVTYLVSFFDLPEKMGEEKEIDWAGDIEINDVSFTYPNSEKASLRHLTLTIKAGETIAIVGENGAGKSTLTKVLMGIYEPTAGKIVVGGVDTKGAAPSSRFKGLSAVFQKFQRYQLTLKENIELSDIHLSRDITALMEQAGVEHESKTYPNGVETILSREFDGIDLSGGQWQRIAIARGLYRTHDLIVLDEPTAAIDPIEESRLYEKFTQLAMDKTAIIVTHRLTSAQLADRIIVMKEGQIVEEGSHEALMMKNELYAKMYKTQKQWYMN